MEETMRKIFLLIVLIFVFCVSFAAFASAKGKNKPEEVNLEKIKKIILEAPDEVSINEWNNLSHLCNVKAQIKKFAPIEIVYDKSLINANDQKVLEKLIEAVDYIHKIFLRQVYYKNEKILKQLTSSNKPEDKVYLEYFKINCAPFSRLEGFKTFYDNNPRPHGANFYPIDMTKEEFEEWLEKHPEDKKVFTSSFTVIKRYGDKLTAVLYSQEYAELLKPAAKAMKKAATLTDSPSLKKYLISRAEALLSCSFRV